MDICLGLPFYIETGVIAIFILLVLILWICKCLGYIVIHCPMRRRQNYVDLDDDTERDTNTTNPRDSLQVDYWIQKRLNRLEEIEESYENKRSDIESFQEQLRKEKEEKEDALRRLSAIMSSRLKDGNPNVTDLNDQNRPVKVGEQFSELYDNQWTDAYSAILTYFGEEKNEPEIIGMLLEILEQCFMFCKDKAAEQLKHIHDDVTKITLAVTTKVTKLPDDLMQRIKEERKMRAADERPNYNELVARLKEHFSTNDNKVDFLDDHTVVTFTHECLKICWLMVLQDPPMSMILKPSKNPHDDFKAYKNNGKHVSFVVWPALLLEEGGWLISKGIAEFHV